MKVIYNKQQSHEQISEYFKAHELTCHCNKCHISIIDERLLHCLDILRNLWGLPIVLNSAYRCQEYNRSLDNSSDFSQHIIGRAVDLPLPVDEHQRDSFVAIVDAVFNWTYLGQGFIHADVRDS